MPLSPLFQRPASPGSPAHAAQPRASQSRASQPVPTRAVASQLQDGGIDADVVIVGGGIVGSLLACCLGMSDLRVVLLEAQAKSIGLHNRRAYALTLLTRDIFQGLGLWAEIESQVTACDRIRLSDGEHPGVVWFSAADLGLRTREHSSQHSCQNPVPAQHAAKDPATVYVGEHRVLLQALQRRLASLPHLHWQCETEVSAVEYHPDHALLHLRTPSTPTHPAQPTAEPHILRTRLVIAADGARSPLREAAGIRTWGWKYWQSCIGFTVRTEKPHHNIAYERFWPSGPFAILPLPGQRAQVVWTAPHAEAQRLAQLDEAAFLAELQPRFGPQMGQLQLDGPRGVFPVRLMQSRQYRHHRLALIGDAAHNCHPVGGQGLNLGLRDAAALADVILSAHQRGQDLGNRHTLQRYQRWRQPENLLILGFTDLLDRSFSSPWPPVVVLRRFGLWSLRRIPWIRRLALGLMTGQTGTRPAIATPSQPTSVHSFKQR